MFQRFAWGSGHSLVMFVDIGKTVVEHLEFKFSQQHFDHSAGLGPEAIARPAKQIKPAEVGEDARSLTRV